MRRLWLAAAAALVGASAAAAPATREEQSACRPDVRRHCASVVSSDNQKYRECLQAHFSELSQKCQQVLMNHANQQ